MSFAEKEVRRLQQSTMVLKTYADWENAMRAAQVIYDHSRAKMVTRTKVVKKSRKTAFLSVVSAKRHLVNKCCDVSPESDATSSTPASIQKSQTRQPTHKCSSNQGNKTSKIQIFISTPLTSTLSLQLHPSTSISDLKGLLQDKLGIEPEKQHLFTRQGLELRDALSITDHGIEHDATVELRLVSGLLGGRKKNKKSGKLQQPEQTQSSQQPIVPAAEETRVAPQTSSEGAASAALSTPVQASAPIQASAPVQASTVANIGAVIIPNSPNSTIIFGNVHSSSFNYPQMPAAIDVTCKENPQEGMNAQLFEMLKLTVKQYGKTHIMDLMVNVFKECDSELQEATMGSVKFILRVKSRGGLDKLWAMYTTGELAKRLTTILITNELTTEDKSDMAIKVTMNERDYRECCKLFDKMQKEYHELSFEIKTLPRHVQSWPGPVFTAPPVDSDSDSEILNWDDESGASTDKAWRGLQPSSRHKDNPFDRPAGWKSHRASSHETATHTLHQPGNSIPTFLAHPLAPSLMTPVTTQPSTIPSKAQSSATSQLTPDDEGEEEEWVQLVEVTGFKPTTSEEMLQMYFENPRKSKGGEIETWEMDAKTGTVQIKYMDPSVAKAVAEKTHKLAGVNLTVRLDLKRKPRPRPVKKRCLFLRGIPDGCPMEHVQVYLENCSGMDVPRVEFGGKPGTALCAFAQDILDLQKVIQKICSKKLKNAWVTAEVVHEPDCILVQGLKYKTSSELIELYFDNKKKSGGGGVREVLPGNAEDEAIVYFEDWEVVANVLSKKGPQKVGNAEVLVEEYHDCLGRLSELDVPTPHTPKPMSVQVPQDIMEFIFGAKGKHTKKKLLEELKKVKALLRWPDGDKKTAARLEPLEEDGQPQSSWLNWSQLCVEVLTGFLEGCRSTEVNVPSPLWKEASVKLVKINATQICSVLDDQTHSVQLVGEQQDVDAVAADILVVIKELQAKAASDAQQTKEEIVMPPNKLKLFTQCGICRKMEKMFPDLKITIAPIQGQMGLIVEGTRKKVVEAELWIGRQMDGLNSVEFKTGMGKTAFIRDVSDKIHEILGSKDINAACNISADNTIKIYGSSKKDTSLAKMYIDQEIEEDVIRINGPAVIAVLKSQDGIHLVAGINKKKFVKADIKIRSGNIELAGFRNELKETKQHILAFLKDTVKVKGTIQTKRSKVRLITSFHGQELTGFTAKHQREHVIIQPQMNVGFHVEGNEEGLDAASQFISQLLARIKEKPYPISKIGMVQLFRETKGKKFLESVEKELECVIDVIGENEKDDEDVEGATASPPQTGATEVLCRVTLRGGCTLRVCKGDLTKQKVDCIVNAANVNLRHIGGLSAAVLQAGGQIIQTECDQILKEKGRKLFKGEPVCTSSGSLPCMVVIHVAGPRWQSWKRTTLDDEPTHEEHLLFDGVVKCLQLANKLKMESIAIPAISTGVYGFPTKLAAVQIVNAVVEFSKKVPDSSLTEISLTNHDQPTCDVMKQVTMDQLGYRLEEEPSLDITAGLAKSFFAGAAAEDTSDDESQRETILLQICAMDDVTIQRATGKIDRYQDQEFTSEDMPDSHEMIAKMTEEHHAELRNIERKYNVRIELSKGHAKFFRVEGLTINVKDAIISIQELFTRIQVQELEKQRSEHLTKEDMPDSLEMIAKMTEEHHAELRNIERKYNVLIEHCKGHAKFLRVQGLTIDVKDARFSLQELFTRIWVKKTPKQRSEHLAKEVQWKCSTPTGVEDYKAEINVIIEDVYQSKQPSVVLDVEEGQVAIDFSIMQELSRAGALSVNRVDLQQAAKFETPSCWKPMKKGEHCKLVKLMAASEEYTDVERRFRSTMGTQATVNQIVEILRIQNKHLMIMYQFRKAALEDRLGRTNIEETLYHGTDEQTCDKINKFGFNRSFCGKNVTMYGNGTYFAAEASYWARSNYAKPNASKTKHIYATKVLVGDFTTGAQGMVIPPNKPNNPDQLYDSVVDNVGKPSIYVIFHDALAYPGHLIKYK